MDEFTDVVVVCGTSTVRAHKIVLAAASPLFKSKLMKKNKLRLKNLNQEEFESVIEFIYKGRLRICSQNYHPRFQEIAEQLSLTVLTSKKGKRSSNQNTEPLAKKQRISSLCSPLNIGALPPEVLSKILSWLPTNDLLENAALVSKQFHDLTKTPFAHIKVRGRP